MPQPIRKHITQSTGVRPWIVLRLCVHPWQLSYTTHPLPFSAHRIADHIGPIGGSRGSEGWGLPAHLEDPWGLATLDLHILGWKGRSWDKISGTETSSFVQESGHKHMGLNSPTMISSRSQETILRYLVRQGKRHSGTDTSGSQVHAGALQNSIWPWNEKLELRPQNSSQKWHSG